MNIDIQGKGMDVSNYLTGIVEKKVGKLRKYFKPETIAHVTLCIERSRHIAEVTIPFDGIVLRAEETSSDMYASIDGCLKKLEHQIVKHRTKLEKKLHHDAFKEEEMLFHDAFVEEDDVKLVKTKKISVKPMSLDEATMQMELVGHSFFVYRDADYDEINVIYKRKDGNIGLIETN